MLSRPDLILHWDVLETHLDEACFLWTQWEQRLSSADFSLDELARGDEQRLRAHLKALAAGGARVRERLLRPLLEDEDAEKLRVAGFVLVAEGEGQEPESVLRVLHEGTDVQRVSVQRVLELSGRKNLEPLLHRELVEGPVPGRARVLDVLAFRQSSAGLRLGDFLRSEDLEVRIAAMRAAYRRRMTAGEVDSLIIRALGAAGPEEREAALGLGLRWGLRGSWLACPTLAKQDDAAGQLARLALAMSGEGQDLQRLVRLLEVPVLRRHTLWALGFSGQVVAVDACLSCVREPMVSAVAAEAFCAITGLSLEGTFRQARRPEESTSSDEDEPLDMAAMPGPDDELALPWGAALEDWWRKSREDFDQGTRYLLGRPFSMPRLLDAIASAPMRRRPVLALELAIRTRAACEVQTRAFSEVQRLQLQQGRNLPGAAVFLGPFSRGMSA